MDQTPVTTFFVLSKHCAPASWALPVETKRVLTFGFETARQPLRTLGKGATPGGTGAQSCAVVLLGKHPDLQDSYDAQSTYRSATLLSFREPTKPPFQLYRLEGVRLTHLWVLPPQAGHRDGVTTTHGRFDFAQITTEVGGPSCP